MHMCQLPQDDYNCYVSLTYTNKMFLKEFIYFSSLVETQGSKRAKDQLHLFIIHSSISFGYLTYFSSVSGKKLTCTQISTYSKENEFTEYTEER